MAFRTVVSMPWCFQKPDWNLPSRSFSFKEETLPCIDHCLQYLEKKGNLVPESISMVASSNQETGIWDGNGRFSFVDLSSLHFIHDWFSQLMERREALETKHSRMSIVSQSHTLDCCRKSNLLQKAIHSPSSLKRPKQGYNQTRTEQHSVRKDGVQFDRGNTVPRCFSCQSLSPQGPLPELTAANHIQQQ